MEVMNSTEFEQKDVLVGGSGKTGKFTVNDDPHLMSMLSTSLYANPLRTMIQEIMFNAWDAHRMGKCQDKPIDVYLNETTGLIVRDYGPGIPPEDIDEIYCTYGASTKRDDSTQTGGFGLGSKSPYAYNDSFMVTNNHGGKKSMYIMRRVHDDNDGGPGYDHIVDGVDTEEQGLMVTVPLKGDHDRQRAYRYMKEILFLSGIKVNIHYEGTDEQDESIEAESLAPGEFINSDMEHRGLYAVYGGVKYEIPKHEDYQDEYTFLERLSAQLGALYIGFKPNSLTPLPNREGLNMRERSIESIKESLETIQEYFMTHLIPATKAAMIECFRSAKSSKLQAQFLIYKWKKVGDHLNLEDLTFKEDPVMDLINDRRAKEQNASVWTSVAKMALSNSRFVAEMIGYEKFYNMKALIWAKEMPEYRSWRYYVSETSNRQDTENMQDRTNYAKWLIGVQKSIEAITDAENKPRVKGSNPNWFILTNQRRAGKADHISGKKKEIINALARKNKLILPKQFHDDQLWFQKDGNPFNHTMKHGSVIVAKTAAALAETDFKFQAAMIPRHPNTYGYDRWHWGQWVHNSNIQPIAAFIVHKKKGQYEEVVQMLRDEGYQVIEADEPQPKMRKVERVLNSDLEYEEVEVEPGYHVVDFHRTDWDGEEKVLKPSTYLYCTKTDIRGYDKPYDEGFTKQLQEYAPKMVMVNNKKVAEKLSKAGALSYEERAEQIVEKLLADKDRIRIMRLHHYMHTESNIPSDILKLAEVQKMFGIPYLRSRQVEIFERDRNFLARYLTDNRRYYHRNDPAGITPHLKDKVKKAFAVANDDDSVVLARKIAKASLCFDESALRIKTGHMKPGEKKMFSQKLIRFLRTV